MHTTSRAEHSRVELGPGRALSSYRSLPLTPKNCNGADCGRVARSSRLPSRNAISLGCTLTRLRRCSSSATLLHPHLSMYKLPKGCTVFHIHIRIRILNRIRVASCQVDAGNIAAGIFRCVILLLIPLAWAKIRYTAVGTFANHEKETKRASRRNTSAVRVTARTVPDAIDMLYIQSVEV